MATLDKEIEIIMLKGEKGGTINRVEKTSTVGAVDTYTIYMDEGTTFTFQVTNGSSISSIEKTSTSGNVDTYTITLTNGDTSTFTVTNGEVTTSQMNSAIASAISPIETSLNNISPIIINFTYDTRQATPTLTTSFDLTTMSDALKERYVVILNKINGSNDNDYIIFKNPQLNVYEDENNEYNWVFINDEYKLTINYDETTVTTNLTLNYETNKITSISQTILSGLALYRHDIITYKNSGDWQYRVSITVYTNSSDPITSVDTLRSLLFTTTDRPFTCSGYINHSGSYYPVIGVIKESLSVLNGVTFLYVASDGTGQMPYPSNQGTYSDIVTQVI